MSPKVFI